MQTMLNNAKLIPCFIKPRIKPWTSAISGLRFSRLGSQIKKNLKLIYSLLRHKVTIVFFIQIRNARILKLSLNHAFILIMNFDRKTV